MRTDYCVVADYEREGYVSIPIPKLCFVLLNYYIIIYMLQYNLHNLCLLKHQAQKVKKPQRMYRLRI